MNFDFTDPNIDDLEFARRFSASVDAYLQSVKPEDFEFNPIQVRKFNELVAFFTSRLDDMNGSIEDVDISTAFGTGDITVNFKVFGLSGTDVQRFCNVIQYCSAISVDVLDTDEVSISCTIPNVFIMKGGLM